MRQYRSYFVYRITAMNDEYCIGQVGAPTLRRAFEKIILRHLTTDGLDIVLVDGNGRRFRKRENNLRKDAE